ncbi:MAG: 4Fe-4S binding protein [Elusimicrobiota bacterium]|jgi:Pyruvate/2-oxoacid:ferredoxin oxidoreductase delta subunit
MKRNIVIIDESKCDGCGLCAQACAEGAIRIVAGKAKLVSETYCDGLGACLGECPRGAMTVEAREAAAFDPAAVQEHLEKARGGAAPASVHGGHGQACPSARMMDFKAAAAPSDPMAAGPSALTHWPIQLQLIAPAAPYFKNADLLLSADCAAYALGGFHAGYLQGRRLAIACPKLDSEQDVYLEKLKSLIEDARINTLTVIIMQVPCCSGLFALAQRACAAASRKVPLKRVVVGLRGEILSEEWV